MSAPFFCIKLEKNKMTDENSKKTEIPSRMRRVAFPKAKYGVYLALIIILLALLVLYKDLIL